MHLPQSHQQSVGSPRSDDKSRARRSQPDALIEAGAETPPEALDADVAAIARIGAVPTILKVVSEMTGLRLALIARVTQQSWVACAVSDRMNFGLGVGDQLAVATTLCSEVRDSHEPIIIEHASREPEYRSHPTPKLYGLESYIAVPIFRSNGEYFGNICALDSAPATALREPKTLAMMQLFAELVSLQLAAEEQSVSDREALSQARTTAELREQFIAVLGHDLRNPLFAIVVGSGYLLGLPQDARQRGMLIRIQCAAERMSRLINDIMDFARGRLGGGIGLERRPVLVANVVNEVVGELSSAHPERTIRVEGTDAGTALLDGSRTAQMLSNLVGNAVQHSAPHEPVDVRLEGSERSVRVAVISRGEPIPAEMLPRLFQPYVRAAGDKPRQGLGLGLYIAGEIARGHGGSIAVQSTDDGITTFTVDLPRAEGEARSSVA